MAKEWAKEISYGTLVYFNWGATIRPYSSNIDMTNKWWNKIFNMYKQTSKKAI